MYYMAITSLYLRHFRSYEEGYYEFDEGVNLLYGANAQGKTSVLESIYCFMVGRSFRTQQTGDLIQHNKSSFQIECRFVRHQVDQMLKFASDGKQRTLIYNHTPLPTLSSLLGILPGVITTPDDINLIKGAPAIRRQFLDLQLAQADPLYLHHLSRYTKALRQRNHLLKTKQKITIASWEQEMSRSAAYLVTERAKALIDLERQGQRLHLQLTGEKKTWTIQYKTSGAALLSDKETLYNHHLDQFQKYREKELILGYTLTGPHKDDFLLMLDGNEVRHFASEGQQRSSIMALKLAEWQRLQSQIDSPPLLMIDDVGLSLDQARRSNLFDMLGDFNQVFLTATDASLFDENSVKGKKIKVGMS